MHDIIGDPGLIVVTRQILSNLDLDSLELAAQVSPAWYDVIVQERRIWIAKFQVLKSEFAQESGRGDYFPNKDWQIIFDSFENQASFDELVELSKLLRSMHKYRWTENPHVAMVCYGSLKLFKAHIRICKPDVNMKIG